MEKHLKFRAKLYHWLNLMTHPKVESVRFLLRAACSREAFYAVRIRLTNNVDRVNVYNIYNIHIIYNYI